MKSILFTIIFSLILGLIKAQVSFFVSSDVYLKMSFNSDDPFGWDTKTAKVSDYFTYESQNYSLINPVKLGGAIGVKIKNNHEFTIGLHSDGVSSKTYLRFSSYQPTVDYTIPNRTVTKFTTNQTRFFLNYKYAIIYKPNKFVLSIMPTFGLSIRPGPKGNENVGSFGSSGLLTKEGIRQENSSTSYTSYGNKVLTYGLGLSSDFYSKDKYLFSLSLQFSHARAYLGSEVTRMKIINSNTNESNLYLFELFQRTSGLYIGISKKIQLFSKKEKEKNS